MVRIGRVVEIRPHKAGHELVTVVFLTINRYWTMVCQIKAEDTVIVVKVHDREFQKGKVQEHTTLPSISKGGVHYSEIVLGEPDGLGLRCPHPTGGDLRLVTWDREPRCIRIHPLLFLLVAGRDDLRR